jgi:Domain of unknown function (DUF4440)
MKSTRFARPAGGSGRLTSVMALIVIALLVAAAGSALAQDEDVDALGQSLVDEFVEIAMLPDNEKAAALESFLAPEFQLVRGSGEVMDKATYIADPSSVVEASISDVSTTGQDGVLVVSWTIQADITIDGVTTDRSAPRLSIFHLGDDGRWRLAAHANFSAPEPASDS